MFGEDTFIELKFKLADNSAYAMKLDGEIYTVGELVKVIDEVKSLREENVKLNKDRSALQNINEGLRKEVCNYEVFIANNLTGIRCKELEGEVEQLKQQVSDLEEIIRDNVDAQSDEIHNIEVEIDSLEKAYAELLGLFHGKLDEVESLQEKNKSLEESVSHYQKVIEDNIAGIHCKELGKVIQEQQRELDIRSDKIHNLKTELDQLEDCYKELLCVNHAKHAQVQDQQEIIEFQKKDIECLVKLNAELQNRLDTYKEVLYFNIYSGR